MNEPTILVPGFGDDTRILRNLTAFLAREQLNPYPMSPQPSNGVIGIDLLAAQLAAQIEATFAPDQPINLVGFSMGGLICRAYVQKLSGARQIQRLITVATPHQGTWTAYSYNRPACLQMRPGSQFLTELNGDTSALERIKFVSIWTPLDLTIVPANSSRLLVGETLSIVSPLHSLLLADPRILRVIANILRQTVAGQAESTTLS
ncbi:alpha/beta fold hydrolase [soil metagenome]